MRNKSFGDLQEQLSEKSLAQGTASTAMRRQSHPGEALTVMTLTEPLFQDLSHTSRFFVDYCERLSCLTLGSLY